MAERQGFVIYHDWRPAVEALKPAEAGALLMALLDYSEFGTAPELKGAAMVAFGFCSTKVDRDRQKFMQKCEQNSQKAMKRWHGTECNGTNNDAVGCNGTNNDADACQTCQPKPKPKRKKERIEKKAGKPPRSRFVPPTVDQVSAYCTEKGYHIEPSRFVDYYTANGWKQGKGKPIVDWKAAVRTWEQRDKPKETPNGGGYGDVV